MSNTLFEPLIQAPLYLKQASQNIYASNEKQIMTNENTKPILQTEFETKNKAHYVVQKEYNDINIDLIIYDNIKEIQDVSLEKKLKNYDSKLLRRSERVKKERLPKLKTKRETYFNSNHFGPCSPILNEQYDQRNAIASKMEIDEREIYIITEPPLFESEYANFFGILIGFAIVLIIILLTPIIFLFWTGTTLIELITGEAWLTVKKKQKNKFWCILMIGVLLWPVILLGFFVIKILDILFYYGFREQKFEQILKYFYSQSCFPGEN